MSIPLPEAEEISDQPINQYHAELLSRIDTAPARVETWNTKPADKCIVYDWTENETR